MLVSNHTSYISYRGMHTWFSFELELNASPICCDVDFSLCGCNVDAAESDLPLSLSPKCSVVDFSESGYMIQQRVVSMVLDALQWREVSQTYLQGSRGLVSEALAAGVGHSDRCNSCGGE